MGFFVDEVKWWFTLTLRGINVWGGLLGVSLWVGLCAHTPAGLKREGRYPLPSLTRERGYKPMKVCVNLSFRQLSVYDLKKPKNAQYAINYLERKNLYIDDING
jgi:hypothetical protein